MLFKLEGRIFMSNIKSVIPPIRVETSLKQDLESVLQKGETVSSFVKSIIEREVEYRKIQNDFLQSALRAEEKSKKTGIYYTHEEVMGKLKTILDTAKTKK